MPRRVCVPLEAGSTPSPGRTEAIGAVASTVGTWTGRVQATPFRELVSTMSFWSHSRRKRQSLQAAQIVPSAPTSAETKGGMRKPSTASSSSSETRTGWPKVKPPSVERTAAISSTPSSVDSNTEKSTTSDPSLRTTGCAPFTIASTRPRLGVGTADDQVAPPSFDDRTAITPRTRS